MTTLYDFSVLGMDGQEHGLSAYRGQVLLIVNTASFCGFTPQYRALQQLQEQFGAQGFSVLAFPCNQFGQQEPKSNAEIAEFCQVEFQTTFPVFAKLAVNGEQTAPVYAYLKQQCPDLLGMQWIKWNFTKFLVDRNGIPVKRYAPMTSPLSLVDDIKALL
ncbi:glutathione peroxidase [Patescibacteria group bacterium]|nr:glutathione peroxidase [Patescibacteria group bacterium]